MMAAILIFGPKLAGMMGASNMGGSSFMKIVIPIIILIVISLLITDYAKWKNICKDNGVYYTTTVIIILSLYIFYRIYIKKLIIFITEEI